jgi:fucose permease
MLPHWFLTLELSMAEAGHCFLILNLGILAAALAWARLVPAEGAPVRHFFTFAGILAAASLVGLSFADAPLWLLPSLFGLGISVGALATGVSWLLSETLLEGRAPSVLNLAGVSFGAGTVSVCLLIWAGVDQVTWPLMVRL